MDSNEPLISHHNTFTFDKDMKHKQLEVTFIGNEGAIAQVAVNSETVISLSEENALRFWSRTSRQCLRTIHSREPLHSLVLHSSSILVTGVCSYSNHCPSPFFCSYCCLFVVPRSSSHFLLCYGSI
eukprot:m.136752 g.136752  ORF g.136752 m.136752 type:complete len:126 (+) comp13147_c0_seq3:94-471(+)